MEFLSLVLFFMSVFVLFRYPRKEKLAWSLFLAATGVSFFMYFVSSWPSLLPFGAY